MSSETNSFPKIEKSNKDGLFVFSPNWLSLEVSEEYKQELLKCIRYCRPDMYFHYLYRFIIRYDFEELNKPIESRQQLYSIYQKVAKKILYERCYIMFSQGEVESPVEWRIPYQNFSKVTEAYKETVLDYINYNETSHEHIGMQPNANPYFSEACLQFFQNLMFVGFLIANSRIEDEIHVTHYFGADIMNFIVEDNLTIYLTPYGMIHNTQLTAMSTDELISLYNQYVSSLGFDLIRDKDKISSLNTAIVLKKDGRAFYHQLTKFHECAHDYIIKRINKPHITSLKIETQVSYCELKKPI